MFRKARQLHFVGIGGTGMCGIAEVLVNMGYSVSGSDLAANASTERLTELGADVRLGHDPSHVHGSDVIIISSAVSSDNPEVMESRRLNIPVIPRAEMLAELMRLKHGVAVAGAHGKTTTTAMVAGVLSDGGLDPTVVIGGRVGSLKSGAKLGRGEVMVAEADESDGSFLKMKPTIAVVTNIDREHLDYYGGLPAIRQAFTEFLDRVPFYGAAIACIDDSNVRAILPEIDRKRITYGMDEAADIRACDIEIAGFGSNYVAHGPRGRLGEVRLALPGRHMVSNSLAAIAVGLEFDLPFESIAASLAGFRGVDRRMQRRGEFGGAIVLDDYGHHPTEIVATLGAVRDGYDARTLVVFQPHRYSRTEALLEEFGGAFGLAEMVIVMPIYAAGERPIKGLTDAKVAEAIRRHGHENVVFEADRDRIVARLRAEARPGDVVLTLGAGDVWKIGVELLAGAEAGNQPRRSA